KGRLVVDTDHADDLPFAEGDKICVLGVVLIDESAVARIVVLGNLSDERAIVEAVDLLEFLAGFRAFEDVTAVLVHPRPPPTQLSGAPTRRCMQPGSPPPALPGSPPPLPPAAAAMRAR